MMCKHFFREGIFKLSPQTSEQKVHFFTDFDRERPWQEEEKGGHWWKNNRGHVRAGAQSEEALACGGRLWPWHQPSAPSASPEAPPVAGWGAQAQPGPAHFHKAAPFPGECCWITRTTQGLGTQCPEGTTPPWLQNIYHPPHISPGPSMAAGDTQGRALSVNIRAKVSTELWHIWGEEKDFCTGSSSLSSSPLSREL